MKNNNNGYTKSEKTEELKLPFEAVARGFFEYENDVKNLFTTLVNYQADLIRLHQQDKDISVCFSKWEKEREIIVKLHSDLIDHYKKNMEIILNDTKSENDTKN